MKFTSKTLNPSQNTFSKTDTTFFKGIAILMIVIHNYMHIISGFGIENEFLFSPRNFERFLRKITDLTIQGFIGGLFSFLGHYGVQLFFFFSAYGLTIQYSKWEGSDFKFILHRLKKVYFLMAFAVLFCVVYFHFIGISIGFVGTIVRALILGSTLNSFTNLSMFSGPFWFFAAIIQFYILFPLLYRFVIKFNLKNSFIPFLASFIIIYILYLTLDNKTLILMGKSVNLALFRNVIGHLPELILGITMAHFGFKNFQPWVIILALIIFMGSQISEWLFPLSFLSMTILLITLITQIEKHTNDYFKKTLLYIGNISMILFIVNGPFRTNPLFEVSSSLKFERTFLFLFLLFILSHLLYLLYEFFVRKLKI